MNNSAQVFRQSTVRHSPDCVCLHQFSQPRQNQEEKLKRQKYTHRKTMHTQIQVNNTYSIVQIQKKHTRLSVSSTIKPIAQKAREIRLTAEIHKLYPVWEFQISASIPQV